MKTSNTEHNKIKLDILKLQVKCLEIKCSKLHSYSNDNLIEEILNELKQTLQEIQKLES